MAEKQKQRSGNLPWWGWLLIVLGALSLISRTIDADTPPSPPVQNEIEVQVELEDPTSEEESTEIDAEWASFGTVSLEGSGDDVLLLENPITTYVALGIRGNESNRFMGIRPIFVDGDTGSSLVSTTKEFEGAVLLSGSPEDEVVGFEIEATGPWSIEVESLNNLVKLERDSRLEGNGYSVVRIDEIDELVTMTVTGNADERFFGIRQHRFLRPGSSAVSTTEAYEGEVLLDKETVLLEISAEGDWAISLD